MRSQKIEISHRTVIFTVLFLLLIWFLYFIRDIILQIYVALLIMTVLNPLVTNLNTSFRIPRALSVLIVYLVVIILIGISFGGIVQPLFDQSTRLISQFPLYLRELQIPSELVDDITNNLLTQLGQIPSQIVSIGISLFSNVVSVLAVMIIALYLLLGRNKIDDQLDKLLNKQQISKFNKIFNDLEKSLGGWARGQLILMFIVGLTTYLGLVILGIPFALPLAVLAGLMEFVPNLGPTLAAIPAVFVAFSISPVAGVAVLALYVLIQQLENYLLVPQVMNRAAGVSPIITLISLLIGFKVAGVVGALLSVPIFLTIRVFISNFLMDRITSE